ncbi:MAG TPA: hypothetical protein VKB59_12365 [Micromonosporaceae bacterium]|nr:hypothetical protein [Micromonosporaceae bacterium]
MMTRDEADRLLASIGAAYDRVATTMYAIDNHPALQYLRTQTHTGITKQMRDAVIFDVDVMWAQFNAIGDILTQARGLRAAYRPSDSRWTDLARLLAAPIVTLDNAGMPVTVAMPTGSGAAASLASGTVGAATSSGGRIVGAVRVGDVAVSLQARCLNAMGRLEGTARAWNSATAAVAEVTAAMDRLVAQAGDIGDATAVQPLQRRTDMLRDLVLGDPLAHSPGGLPTSEIRRTAGDLLADIGTAASRLRTESGLRDEYPERIAALLGDVDALASEESETAAAFALAAEKIAATGLPDAPAAAAVLRTRIDALDALRDEQQWRRLADDVTTVRAAVGRAIERAQELRAAAAGLVARRDELRGRLAGYRAKAATYHVDEHEQLEPLYTHARTLLYTAPCDLPAATKSVVAYQTRLAELLGKTPDTDAGAGTTP